MRCVATRPVHVEPMSSWAPTDDPRRDGKKGNYHTPLHSSLDLHDDPRPGGGPYRHGHRDGHGTEDGGAWGVSI
jgi:hypothetical protein